MDILQTIANAKPGSMIDIRSPDNQVDSFPVEEVQALLPIPVGTSLTDIAPDGLTYSNYDILTATHPSPIK